MELALPATDVIKRRNKNENVKNEKVRKMREKNVRKHCVKRSQYHVQLTRLTPNMTKYNVTRTAKENFCTYY